MRRLAVALAVVVLAASCSGSDDDASDAETEADPSTTVTADADATATTTEAPSADGSAGDPVAFLFTVEGVTGGSNVPVEFTCDGANDVPTVTVEGVPDTVGELALVVDDPDAPTEAPFVHWVVYGIGSDTATITDGDGSLTYGVTDAGTDSWFGPCPPPGDGLHTYRWRLFGLSDTLGLDPGLDGRMLEEAIAGSVVTEAVVIASYERAG